MLYYSYTKTGEFDGFYDTEINNLTEDFIKNNCIKINEELWQELLKSKYNIDIDIVESYKDKECTIKDINILFKEKDFKDNFTPETMDNIKLLAIELANCKIESMRQHNINKNLLEQIGKLKIEIMKGGK